MPRVIHCRPGTMLDSKTILEAVQTISGLASIIKILRKDGKPLISMKHLVVKSDFVVKELLDGHFQDLYEQLHAKRVYIQDNEVSAYLRSVRRDHVRQTVYDNWEQTPVSELRDPLLNTYERTVEIQELVELGRTHDPMITGRIVGSLTNSNQQIDPSDFCRISYFVEYGCQEAVAEMIAFRPIWFVLLWIENLSDGPVEVGDYSGRMYYPNVELDYRQLSFEEGEDYRKGIPFNVLQKEDSVLIPEFILLAPIDPCPTHLEQEVKCDQYDGELDLLYAFTPFRTEKTFHMIGPALSVSKVSLANRVEDVHQFDITNTLTVSDIMECGCCPYVIGYREGQFQCIRDVLSDSPDKVDIRGFDYVVIAEIEDEITRLGELSLDDGPSSKNFIVNKVLRKGDFVIIRNLNRRYVALTIRGEYFAKRGNVNSGRALVWKYQNLRRFIFELTELGAPCTWFDDEPGVAHSFVGGASSRMSSAVCQEFQRTDVSDECVLIYS